MKLTKPALDVLDARKTRYIVWDDDLPGFGVRVEPTGVKTFLVRYRGEGGGRTAPQRQVTIGK